MAPNVEQGDNTMDPKQPTYLEILAYQDLARGATTSILQYIRDYQAPEGAAYSSEDLRTDFLAKFTRFRE